MYKDKTKSIIKRRINSKLSNNPKKNVLSPNKKKRKQPYTLDKNIYIKNQCAHYPNKKKNSKHIPKNHTLKPKKKVSKKKRIKK